MRSGGQSITLYDASELISLVILYILKDLGLNSRKGIQFKSSYKYMLTYYGSLISDGSAIPFTAHATSPTITMPRIKAITTGSIPSFLDVILNFAESDTSSTLATQDTWLAQMKAKKTGKLIMYGDDTWIKLFPESFDRADGTSSFFVAVSAACVTLEQVAEFIIRTSPRLTTM